ESRILALVSDFQCRVNQKKNSGQSREQVFTQALEECKEQQSYRFDPKLVDALTLLVMGLQQGLELPTNTPKFSSRMWLIDSKADSDARVSEQKLESTKFD
ncbi:MAG: metal-dependent phosphohydrolase, partial [Cyanobacteria bacterium J06639_18]